MKFTIESIRLSGCQNLWHEILLVGKLSGAMIVVDGDKAKAILSKCPEGSAPPEHNEGPPAQPKPISPEPLDRWPVWVRAAALLAKPDDKGLGDVIARTVGPIGGDAYKTWFKRVTGKPCGCSERQETLNAIYPLDPNQRT